MGAIVESVDTYISGLETGRSRRSSALILAVVHRLNTTPTGYSTASPKPGPLTE
jgi:hypothetical protein